jgi:superfamily I DNA/RNA helicase
VHRAKGLEAKNVFILKPELLPHPMAKQPWQQEQERNIKYVAFTRALESLQFITED